MPSKQQTSEPTEAVVQFTPQVWQGSQGDQRARIASSRDRVSFSVPIEDATDEDGNLLKSNAYESDHLRGHENAPDWCAEWEGPFSVAVEETR